VLAGKLQQRRLVKIIVLIVFVQVA
jgi:hypothetical protein